MLIVDTKIQIYVVQSIGKRAMAVLTSMMMVMDLISIQAKLIFLWFQPYRLSTRTKVSIIQSLINNELESLEKGRCLFSDYRDIKVTPPQHHTLIKGFLIMAKICWKHFKCSMKNCLTYNKKCSQSTNYKISN